MELGFLFIPSIVAAGLKYEGDQLSFLALIPPLLFQIDPLIGILTLPISIILSLISVGGADLIYGLIAYLISIPLTSTGFLDSVSFITIAFTVYSLPIRFWRLNRIHITRKVYRGIHEMQIGEKEVSGIISNDRVIVMKEGDESSVLAPFDFESGITVVDFMFHTHSSGHASPSPIDLTFPLLPSVIITDMYRLIRVVVIYDMRPFVVIDSRILVSKPENTYFIYRRPANPLLNLMIPLPFNSILVKVVERYLRFKLLSSSSSSPPSPRSDGQRQ